MSPVPSAVFARILALVLCACILADMSPARRCLAGEACSATLAGDRPDRGPTTADGAPPHISGGSTPTSVHSAAVHHTHASAERPPMIDTRQHAPTSYAFGLGADALLMHDELAEYTDEELRWALDVLRRLEAAGSHDAAAIIDEYLRLARDHPSAKMPPSKDARPWFPTGAPLFRRSAGTAEIAETLGLAAKVAMTLACIVVASFALVYLLAASLRTAVVALRRERIPLTYLASRAGVRFLWGHFRHHYAHAPLPLPRRGFVTVPSLHPEHTERRSSERGRRKSSALLAVAHRRVSGAPSAALSADCGSLGGRSPVSDSLGGLSSICDSPEALLSVSASTNTLPPAVEAYSASAMSTESISPLSGTDSPLSLCESPVSHESASPAPRLSDDQSSMAPYDSDDDVIARPVAVQVLPQHMLAGRATTPLPALYSTTSDDASADEQARTLANATPIIEDTETHSVDEQRPQLASAPDSPKTKADSGDLDRKRSDWVRSMPIFENTLDLLPSGVLCEVASVGRARHMSIATDTGRTSPAPWAGRTRTASDAALSSGTESSVPRSTLDWAAPSIAVRPSTPQYAAPHFSACVPERACNSCDTTPPPFAHAPCVSLSQALSSNTPFDVIRTADRLFTPDAPRESADGRAPFERSMLSRYLTRANSLTGDASAALGSVPIPARRASRVGLAPQAALATDMSPPPGLPVRPDAARERSKSLAWLPAMVHGDVPFVPIAEDDCEA